MIRQVTQKLTVELIFDASEKHLTGQAQAVLALKEEADRLGLDLDFDRVLTSGPVRISGSNWDGKSPKVDYDHQVFTAWGWVTST